MQRKSTQTIRITLRGNTTSYIAAIAIQGNHKLFSGDIVAQARQFENN
jgi:hypothetical protein